MNTDLTAWTTLSTLATVADQAVISVWMSDRWAIYQQQPVTHCVQHETAAMNYDNFTNTTLFQHNEVSWYWLIRNTPTFSTFIITVRSSHDEYFFLNFSGVSDALREQHSIHFNLSVQCETTEDTLYTNCRCRQGCCLLLYLMRTHVKSLLYYFPRFLLFFFHYTTQSAWYRLITAALCTTYPLQYSQIWRYLHHDLLTVNILQYRSSPKWPKRCRVQPPTVSTNIWSISPAGPTHVCVCNCLHTTQSNGHERFHYVTSSLNADTVEPNDTHVMQFIGRHQ